MSGGAAPTPTFASTVAAASTTCPSQRSSPQAPTESPRYRLLREMSPHSPESLWLNLTTGRLALGTACTRWTPGTQLCSTVRTTSSTSGATPKSMSLRIESSAAGSAPSQHYGGSQGQGEQLPGGGRSRTTRNLTPPGSGTSFSC